MLASLRTAAGIAVLILGLFAGGTLSGAGFWLWNQFVENPRIIAVERAAQEAICTLKTQDAARQAERIERDRQQAASALALSNYQSQYEARERLRQSVIEQLEQEISDYEHKLSASGRSCPLTADDVEWLRRK
jgi:hypothetical protein